MAKRQGQNPKFAPAGFTIIELLVVISMMMVMVGLFTVNLAGTRATRNLKIAQNELVSNLRKIQSYTLSGRNINGQQVVQYYMLRLKTDSAANNRYVIQAMYKDNAAAWRVSDIETISLPSGVSISGIAVTADNATTTETCALVAYETPYAKNYLNRGCNPSSLPANPYPVQDMDDYKKILTYVSNAPTLPTVTDGKMNITLSSQGTSATKTVTVNGVTGIISFQ